jgi:hypothetical protein
MNGFVAHLYTRLVSTSNYNAIANLHNSQITATHTHTQISVLSLLQSPLAVPWQRVLTQELSHWITHSLNITHKVFSSQPHLKNSSD